MIKGGQTGVTQVFTKKEDLELFDAALRKNLHARQEELRLSDKALGKMAFPYMANPIGKVQALFVGQGAGENRKPQVIKTSELINLCEALGLPWKTVIQDAIREVEDN